MMELEDTMGGKSNTTLIWKQRALQYASSHQKLEQFTNVPLRKTVLVGLTSLIPVLSVIPVSMVRVLLLPAPGEHRRRYEGRSRVADSMHKVEQKALFWPEHQQRENTKRYARSFGTTAIGVTTVAEFAARREQFDVIVTSAGCAEQSLIDLSEGVLSWLDAAPKTPALAHRWSQLSEHYGFHDAAWSNTDKRPLCALDGARCV